MNSPQFIKRLALLFRRNQFRSELDEEMAFHRAEVEKEFATAGMSPEAARYAAVKRLGNATRLKEQSHDVVAFRAETVAQDLRFALRQMRKNPGFAVTAILILALGMGVSVAIFGFVDAALLEPLPYCESEPADVCGRKQLRIFRASNHLPSRLRGLEAAESLVQLA